MKKLYKASSFREFCFVFDTNKHKCPEDAAYEYVTTLDDMGDISDIWEVSDAKDIPDDWSYRSPLGEETEIDCLDFLEHTEWANSIAQRLEKAGYDLELTFTEDLIKVIKDEENERVVVPFSYKQKRKSANKSGKENS